ncbi:MAG TPA: hypothetical protein PKV38_02655, partial [bacterium]|nr:hypothetical protein [bacterium]
SARTNSNAWRNTVGAAWTGKQGPWALARAWAAVSAAALVGWAADSGVVSGVALVAVSAAASAAASGGIKEKLENSLLHLRIRKAALQPLFSFYLELV